MTVRAARGAIKVEQDAPPCVLEATERLVRSMMERNGAASEDLISMLFTVTDDISSVFPAEAARRMGLGLVPLMCAREIPVVGAMPLVVRVLMHLHTERSLGDDGTRVPRRRRVAARRSRMTPTERVAVVGTGLIGTSIALAAARAGGNVSSWDADAAGCGTRIVVAASRPASSLEDAVAGADIVVVATPIPTIAGLVAACLAASPGAVVTDVGSVKTALVRDSITMIADG